MAVSEVGIRPEVSMSQGSMREYVKTVGLAVFVALAVRAVGAEAFTIPSSSMAPTLAVGDNIFVNKLVYGPLVPFTRHRLFAGAPPARGEVVVFASPQDESRDLIKRVIGLPGDRVRVRADGVVEVNGRPLDRCEVGPWRSDGGDGAEAPGNLFRETHGRYSYLTLLSRDPAARESARPPYCADRECTVPAGRVFVMGDNRDDSYDSRYWGFVPLENIRGRAMNVWWSQPRGAGFHPRWERFGQDILGEPGVPPELASGLRACQRRGR